MTRDWSDLRKQFLAEHPEREGGFRLVNGEMYMDTDTALAFGEWVVRKGLAPPEKLELMKRQLNAAIRAAHGGERN
jgi:hypothetical protein